MSRKLLRSTVWVFFAWILLTAGTLCATADADETVTVKATGKAFKYNGGSGSISFTVTGGEPKGTCAVAASSDSDWVVIDPASVNQTVKLGSKGTASKSVKYRVSPYANYLPTQRTAAITIDTDKHFTVTQTGMACTVTLTPTSSSYTFEGENGLFSVKAPVGCAWNVSVDANAAPWVEIEGATTGSGMGSVAFTVGPNSTPKSRTGKIYVTPAVAKPAKKTHSVKQARGSGTGGTVAPPVFTPPGGTYTASQTVTVSSTTPGASIRYTVDGTVPTTSSSTLYTEPLTVSSSRRVKAVAYKSGWITSAVAEAAYVINVTVPATVTLGAAITAACPNPVVSSASGVGEGTGGTRIVPIGGKSAQAVVAATQDGQLLGLSIATAPGLAGGSARTARPLGTATFDTTVDPLSTALALLYLIPGMLPTSNGALIREFNDEVGALTAVKTLAVALQAQLQARGSLDLRDEAIHEALLEAAEAANDLVWSTPEISRAQKIFRPTEQYGLELKEQKAQERNTLFKLSNSAARPWHVWSRAGDAAPWIDHVLVWPAKTGDPTSLTDLIGALKDGISSLVIGTEETKELTVPLDADGRGRLTCYGSIPWAFLSRPDLASLDPSYLRAYQNKLAELKQLEAAGLDGRLTEPTIMHLMTLQVIPLAEVVTGMGIIDSKDDQMWADAFTIFGPRLGTIVQKVLAGNLEGASGDAGAFFWDMADFLIKLVAADIGDNWLDAFLGQVGRPVAFTVFGINQLRTAYHQFNSPLVVEFIAGGSRIAFASERGDGFSHIYLRAEDGSGEIQLTSGAWDDAQPVWSPDGSKIAFVSNRPDHNMMDLYVMNADGSGVTQLTSTPSLSEMDPAWSPSGEWLVYVAPRWIGGSLLTDVYSISPNGGAEVKLSNTNTNVAAPHNPKSPSWSAGNGFIYLQMTAETKVDDWVYLPFTDIYNISPGGASTAAVRITNTDKTAPRLGPTVNHPAVSPDGARILCNYSGSGSGYDLHLLDMSGAHVAQLTSTPGQIEDQAAWSPDGQSIVYRSFSYGMGLIQMMDADGSNVRYVTLSEYNDSDPSVGPAGLLPSTGASSP